MDFIQANPRHSWSLPKPLSASSKPKAASSSSCTAPKTAPPCLTAPCPKAQTKPTNGDSKSYGIGAQILAGLNVGKLRVLGQPSAFTGLTGFGLEVVGFEEAENK